MKNKTSNVIRKISIKNFRSIDKDGFSIDCNAINVFSGGNDVGKSNILRALSIFFGNTRYIPSRDFNMFSRDNNISGKRTCEITIEFNGGTGYTYDSRREIKNYFKADFRIEKKYEIDGVIKESAFSKNLEGVFEEIRDEDKEDFFALFNANFRFYYLPAIKDYQEVIRIKAMMADVFSSSKGKRNKSNSSELYTSLAQDIKSKLDDFHSDFYTYLGLTISSEASVDLVFQSLQFMIDEGSIRKRGKGEQHIQIPIEQRGDGIQMMNIILLLKLLVDKSNQTWILGLEEPEIAMEITKQINLSKMFNEVLCKSAQLFCTTHSPFLAYPDPDRAEYQHTFRISRNSLQVTPLKPGKLNTSIEQVFPRNSTLLAGIEGNSLVDDLFGGDDRSISAGLYYIFKKDPEGTKRKLKELEEENFSLNRTIKDLKLSKYIFICEDSDPDVLKAWHKWISGSLGEDVVVLSSEGNTNDDVEKGIKVLIQQQKPPYKPKVFRQFDRDGLPSNLIISFQNEIEKKCILAKKEFCYKARYLPVCEFENLYPNDKYPTEMIESAKEQLVSKLNHRFISLAKDRQLFVGAGFEDFSNFIPKIHTILKDISEDDYIKLLPGKTLFGSKYFKTKIQDTQPILLEDYIKEIVTFFKS